MKVMENDEGTFLSLSLRRPEMPEASGFEVRARIERAHPDAVIVGILGHWRDDEAGQNVGKTAQAAVTMLLVGEGTPKGATAAEICETAAHIGAATIAALFFDKVLLYDDKGWQWVGPCPPVVPEQN